MTKARTPPASGPTVRPDPTFFSPAVPPIPPAEPDGQTTQLFVENPTLEIAELLLIDMRWYKGNNLYRKIL